ncbi:MAG: DUF1343 domain-containing protein, partial [Verrucomicrobiales bacterium]|nr:DUF1343 domain-containing protein [Verrucomicrobiales bacterium]
MPAPVALTMHLKSIAFLATALHCGAQSAPHPKAVLDAAIAAKNPPGAVLWIEKGDQHEQITLGDRALLPSVEPMTPDTIFDAASLTKVVATTPAVLQLIESGKLQLDAPVQRYLPAFTGDGRDTITLRHLLTHTSGLPAGIQREPAWHGYDAAITRAISLRPDHPPGTYFRYSDVNFILLGHLVAQSSGQTLDAYCSTHIFAPLKLSDTRFNPPTDWRARIAPTEPDENGTLLRGVVHDPTARKMSGVAGNAGLFTNAADLARYARMLLNEGTLDGARILSKTSVRRMATVQTAPTLWTRRGLGMDIDSAFSRPRGSLFPVGSYGHTGFTGTALWIDPYSRSFYIFLSSRLHPQGRGDVRELYTQLGTAIAQQLQITSPPQALSPRLSPTEVPTVLNGIDVLSHKNFAALKGLRIGLITNQTGIDNTRRSTIDLLAKAPDVQIKRLFSPEHGIRGIEDREGISDSQDPRTGLPIISLYGERKAPSAEQLSDLDALVFDIQDIGCRFYTYISTLRLCLESAAAHKKKFIVLDRINPIGGTIVEGPTHLDERSFTATHDIPIRHGMTTGELARLMNAELHLGADLTIIPCEGWTRSLTQDQTGLPWVNPSPNMRNLHAAQLYPGIGLLEFSISVGRGTDTPFEIIGAPYIDDLQLAQALNASGLPGIRFMPIR